MGYYTRFELQIIEDGKQYIDLSDAKKEIEELSDYQPFDESCKWSGHEDDMKKFSENHPDTVFELSGEGEENADLWKKYFKNGKMQVCKAAIIYAPYDASQLR